MEDFLKNINKLNVLVIGDLMVDRYFLGKVSRISPEAPVPIVEWLEEDNRLGGAANVALNVRALGATVHLSGIVGMDAGSECFFGLMAQNGLDTNLVVQSENRPTTIKTRVIAGNQHLLRLDKESTADLDDREEAMLLQSLNNFLGDGKSVDVIILQDYNKGVLTARVIKIIMQLSKELGIPVAVDPKQNNIWHYKGATLFKPNIKEVRDAVPFWVGNSKESLEEAAKFIKEKIQFNYLLITLSERGVFATDGLESFILPTHDRKVADVCGTGDGVIAIASTAAAMGLSLEKIAQLSNIAGGQIVESVGVVPIDKEGLIKEMKERQGKKVL